MTDALLSGLCVVEFAQLLPGPFCTQLLADLGAEVTKIEPPGGDTARTFDPDLYVAANRNKEVVRLDLKSSAGRAEYLELTSTADVVVEGYRPGVADRLGVGYQVLRSRNPGVIYCAISGFGQVGDRVDHPGHDVTYLAHGGGLHLAGAWGVDPDRNGIPVADLTAAHYAAELVLAAAFRRLRGGEGCYLDVALSDAVLASVSVRAGRHLDRPDASGYLAPGNGLYRGSEGHRFAVGAVEDKFWQGVATVVREVEPRIADPRYATLRARRSYGDELEALLRNAFRQLSSTHWVTSLTAAGVPAEHVATAASAADARVAAGRDVVQQGRHGRYVLFPALRDGKPVATLRTEPEIDAGR